ncbi:hypothetical protein [Exilibacterium tricleocarpae]|nr:hypothetical protein [Exilibacterium tricleocarpae]
MGLVNRSILSRIVIIVAALLLAAAATAQIEGPPPSAPAISNGNYTVSWNLYYLQESTDGINWQVISSFANAPAFMEFSKPPGTYYYRTSYVVGFPVYMSVISEPVRVQVTEAGIGEASGVLTF